MLGALLGTSLGGERRVALGAELGMALGSVFGATLRKMMGVELGSRAVAVIKCGHSVTQASSHYRARTGIALEALEVALTI